MCHGMGVSKPGGKEPSLCIKCRHYKTTMIAFRHACTRLSGVGVSLVTGETEDRKLDLDCERQRRSSSAGSCGVSGLFFEAKGQ